MLARGIRLNNPGNIRISNAGWLGKIIPSHDPDFEQFTDAKYGIRAIAIILRNYNKIDGLSTLRGYINRWAPQSENNTNAYLDAVCKYCGTGPDDSFPVDYINLPDLVAAIIHQENGCQPYDMSIIDNGITLAIG